jgi:selenocysteine-specific elongation factor
MHVLATAGHVDHGKSALIRALTGMEPDRWAEERRRGMTLDLGFAWTTLPSGQRVAFVDVPGHERFVPTMLAGVGPVPAVLFLVAADEGWKAQSAEHLAALDALDVRHGVLAVSRCDLADPGPATAQAREQISRTSLGDVEAVAVSAVTGHGLDHLRAALDRLVVRLPAPRLDTPVRFWIDRAFTIRGAGTVVTGTLSAGHITVGDRLDLHPGYRNVTVRAIQSCGATLDASTPVARIGLNLRGVMPSDIHRGSALLSPEAWLLARRIDVRIKGHRARQAPRACVLHIGSAAASAHVRPLGEDTARLTVGVPLPLKIGDRALLRNPGQHRIVGGVTVLDPQPPPLDRRGAARRRADVLATMTGSTDFAGELARRQVARVGELRALGVDVPPAATPVAGWLIDPDYRATAQARLVAIVREHMAQHSLAAGMPLDVARQRLGLPDVHLVQTLVRPPLQLRDQRLYLTTTRIDLPPPLQEALRQLEQDLTTAPWQAPDAPRLQELGLSTEELAVAVRIGALERITDGIFLLPGATQAAASRLRLLGHPFTVSDARRILGTTRRIAVPLLELLDARGITKRAGDGTRHFVTAPIGSQADAVR